MLKKFGDIYASVFLMALSIVMYIATFSIKKLTVAKIGAEFAPRLVAVAIFILSAFLLVNAVKQWKLGRGGNPDQSPSEETQPSEEQTGPKAANRFSVLTTIGLLVLYLALLQKIGFLIMTAVYLFLQMCLLADRSQRRIPLFLAVSLITSASVYFFFRSLFNLMLPSGILG